jgi:uncharacterized membrane protein
MNKSIANFQAYALDARGTNEGQITSDTFKEEMMAYCPSCGSQADGRFCPKCGAAVDAAAGVPPPGTPPPGYAPPPPGYAPPVASAGIQDNVAGALTYLVGFITAIIFLVLEPYNRRPFVRFHAFQSLIFSVGWIIFSIVLSMVFGILALTTHFLWPLFIMIRLCIGLGGFVIWLFLMFKAYNNEKYMLPIVGPIAEKQAAAR